MTVSETAFKPILEHSRAVGLGRPRPGMLPLGTDHYDAGLWGRMPTPSIEGLVNRPVRTIAFVDAKYDMALQCIGKFCTVYDAVRNRIYTYRYPHISSSCNERYNSIQGVYLFVRVTEAGPPISSTGCCTDKRCTQMVWFYWK